MMGVISRALARTLPLMAATSLLFTTTAHAHFKLLKPAPWLKEADDGAPQKGGPCGPGGFDDVQPVPMSMDVTTVKAGETIMVEFVETIHHPGWFRIALAEDRSTFKDPMFPNPSDCRVDMKTVPTTPHDNVLVDGLGMDTNIAGSNRTFKEMVKIPDKPCEKCTLQVIQVMADQLHAPPGCIYYHCADIKIVAASGGGAGSSASAAGTSAAAGASAGGGAGAAATAGSSAIAGSAGSAATSGGAGGSAAGASASTAASKPATAPIAGTPATTTAVPSGSGGMGVATNSATTASTPPTAPSAPASQSSGSCAVLTPGDQHSATALWWMGLALVAARARRRTSR